jgi:FkbM family methyltransferase
MSFARRLVKSGILVLWDRNVRPRLILRGLPRGYRLNVSPAENLGYLMGTAEPHLQRAIRRYVAARDTVYDVGANIGYVSLSLAKQVGPQGRVFAFEPVPKNIQRCRTNIEINQLKNIQLLEFAASNANGEAVIRMTDNLSMASLVWHQENPSATQIVIKTVAIDDLVERGELPPPTFVKIDVEGSEASVLKGMLRTITAAMPVIFVECSDTGREYTWQTLRQLGYQCQSAIHQTPVTTFEQYRHADFLWLPPSNS